MKSLGTWARWTLLPVLLVMLVMGCIDFNVGGEFCAHATTAQWESLCGGGGDAGPSTSTPESTPDAGVDSSCGTSTTCTAPPSQCHESQGTCVAGTCEYPLKRTGAACNDATPKSSCHGTSGTCEAGVCQSSLKPAGADCEDGQLCTVKDTCDSTGKCVGGSPFVCDTPPSQCHQAMGTCANNTCTYKLKATTSSCDDGNACTEADKCNSVGICAGTAKSCTAAADSCYQSTGTCDVNLGRCVFDPKPAGTACESGNKCKEDTCDGSGRCVEGVTDTICPDRSQLCKIEPVCDSDLGCTYTNACTGTHSYCQMGSCCSPTNPWDCYETPRSIKQ